MPPPPSARCAKHIEASAVDVCQRCGAFVCGDCTNVRDEDVYCSSCVPFLDRPASSRAIKAFAAAIVAPVQLVMSWLVGGIASLVGLGVFLLGLAVAAALLGQERSARRRGEAPARGAFFPLAVAAVALDVFGLALLVAGLVWAAVHAP